MSNELGPVVLDIKGLTLENAEADVLLNPVVGGLILFARNYQNIEQLAALTSGVRALRPDMVIAVDQEGGRVQRFREGFTRIPPMQALGRLCQQQPEEGRQLAQDCGWLMAAELRSLDIDISFAPVLDLDDQFSQVIGDRSFSPNPEIVIDAARAFIAGMREAGMAATGKHFPGHGSVRADSHLELPVDNRRLDDVKKLDLLPFRALAKELDGMMPAHVLFPSVDSQPVGFSSYWLRQVLRSDLGFDGVIFSDDLSMAGAASAGGYVERAKQAMGAGCDAVLICNNPREACRVVSHLEGAKQPQSLRLARMRSQAPALSFTELAATERRRTTQERLGRLL